MSSGEAGFYGAIRGAGMGLGFQSMLKDLGHSLKLMVWTDSSAAIGVCSRQGLGKLRHLDTHLLWIQQAVRSKRIDLRKVDGESNPADLFTKHMSSREKLGKLVKLVGCRYSTGRAATAPSRRQGEDKKIKISEANVITDPNDEPFMPHLVFNAEELDRYHPSVSAPDDVDGDREEDIDAGDEVYQHGLKLVDEIKQRMVVQGRRRCEG